MLLYLLRSAARLTHGPRTRSACARARGHARHVAEIDSFTRRRNKESATQAAGCCIFVYIWTLPHNQHRMMEERRTYHRTQAIKAPIKRTSIFTRSTKRNHIVWSVYWNAGPLLTNYCNKTSCMEVCYLTTLHILYIFIVKHFKYKIFK